MSRISLCLAFITIFYEFKEYNYLNFWREDQNVTFYSTANTLFENRYKNIFF